MSKFKVGDKVKFLKDVIPWGDESKGIITKVNKGLKNYNVDIRVYNKGLTVATYMNQLYDEDMILDEPETEQTDETGEQL